VDIGEGSQCPVLTRQPSFRDSELVSDLVAGPCDTRVQIADSFLGTLWLNYQPPRSRPKSHLLEFIDEPLGLFLDLLQR